MYDFTTLSPQDFEHFVRDLLEAEHGWRLKAFGSGPDGASISPVWVGEEQDRGPVQALREVHV